MSGSEAMPAPSTDMGGMDMSGGDMGGMDMSGQSGGHGSDGHGTDAGTPTSRPRVAVLGTFGLVNGSVLLTAFTLRRRGTNRRRGTSVR